VVAANKVFEMDVKKHPTVSKLVNQIRIEQKNTEILHAQIKSGDWYPRKKSEVDKRIKLFNNCKKFNKNDL
jgi:hypothetical protein